MDGVVRLSIINFSLIYILLVIVLLAMKRAGVQKIKLLIIASVRMTIQLILVGFLLQYIFRNSNPGFTALFIIAMLIFSVHRVLKGQRRMNFKFKIITGLSLAISGLTVLIFFVVVVVSENIFNPRYTIPLAGMIIGNAMTGVSLGIKTFTESVELESAKIETLLNLGASPKKILKPFVSKGLETALIPTLNSMLGMGIIFLPGMMTGQILSGTLPTTAIMYQIAIMIAICASVCLSVFTALEFGNKTLYNKRGQFDVNRN